ncbi:MAG: riboflavin synthase [Chloroflexota bacterium]|nr:riboflavin synthase [Chloroflexota bacterium]MDE2941106.1 riboflavin synthase [Chloroflexota bacterium]MDE3267368.1 riboflavin synthase [Chloroflexota bacterium]
MFTGIVQEVGRLKERDESGMRVEAESTPAQLRIGDSVCVNGACLTVTAKGDDWFSVDTMPETLRRTNLGSLRSGDPVNLEPALTLSTPLGGHITQGHVDATGSLVDAQPEGEAVLMRFSMPQRLARYVVEKGFIAVDGVSLTVVECDEESFLVSVVEYTLEHTNLGSRSPGDPVNLEVDILAKYVERLLLPSVQQEPSA